MSIHVTIGYREGFCDNGKPFVEVINKKFEVADEATRWWEESGFNDGDGSVLEVLQAAETEYVGTEHEIMTPNSKTGASFVGGKDPAGYTKLWCCIEGQEGKDTYDERFKDMYVEEIVFMGDGQYQFNGKDAYGKKVWQTMHFKSVKFKVSEVINLPG